MSESTKRVEPDIPLSNKFNAHDMTELGDAFERAAAVEIERLQAENKRLRRQLEWWLEEIVFALQCYDKVLRKIRVQQLLMNARLWLAEEEKRDE